MTLWRFLDLGTLNPYESEVMPEVLIEARRRGLIPNTFLIRAPERFVEIGGRAPLSGVNLEYCKENDIPIIREGHQPSTFVCVFDGKTMQLTLVSDIIDSDPFNDTVLIRGTIKALEYLGLEVSVFEGSNDLMANGKKLSGVSRGRKHGITFDDSSLLVDFDFDLCEGATVPNADKWLNKPVDTHREWVSSIIEQLGRDVPYTEMSSVLKRGFEEVLQTVFEVSNEITEPEKKLLEERIVKYHDPDWLKRGQWSPVAYKKNVIKEYFDVEDEP